LNPSFMTNEVVQATLSAQLIVSSPGFGEKTSEFYHAGQKRLLQLGRTEMLQRGVDASDRDMWQVEFPDQSDNFWLISSSFEDQVGDILAQEQSTANIDVKLWVELHAGAGVTSSAQSTLSIRANSSDELREVLNRTFSGGLSGSPFNIDGFGEFPSSVHIGNNLLITQAKSEADSGSIEDATLSLKTSDSSHDIALLRLPYWRLTVGGKGVTLFIDTEKVPPNFVGTPTSGGSVAQTTSVIALYGGIVFTIGRFLRFVFQDGSKRMVYEELPDTRLLLDLCNGIYIARIQGLLEMEYKLYYQLVQIYRSPELLFDISRSPDHHTTPNGTTDCLVGKRPARPRPSRSHLQASRPHTERRTTMSLDGPPVVDSAAAEAADGVFEALDSSSLRRRIGDIRRPLDDGTLSL